MTVTSLTNIVEESLSDECTAHSVTYLNATTLDERLCDECTAHDVTYLHATTLDERLRDECTAHVDVFDFLRRQVLALTQLEDVLLAIDNLQSTSLAT